MRRVHVPLAENQHDVKLMLKKNHRSRGLCLCHIYSREADAFRGKSLNEAA